MPGVLDEYFVDRISREVIYIILELVMNEWISLLNDGGCRDPKNRSDYHDHFDSLKTHQVK